MRVYDYIAHETERQSGTIQEALGMYRAHVRLCEYESFWTPLSEPRIKALAKTLHDDNKVDYRLVPAMFNQGIPAVTASLIPIAMSNLGTELEKHYLPAKPVERELVDFLVKEFLLIHPFTDGNGRIASLIWNFLLRQLDDPKPMPYFFGENNG